MKSYLSRKDKIILTSIDIIDELGFRGFSVQELARRENMSQSLIYKYFTGMDEITLEVIKYYSRFDIKIINSCLVKELSSEARILDFIKSYVEYYENYPAITALVNVHESLKHDENIRNRMELISANRIKALQRLVELAKPEGIGTRELSAYDISVIIWGYIMNTILIWRTSKYSFRLKEEILSTVEKMLECFNIPDRSNFKDGEAYGHEQ